ncbi:MAG: DNA translocase FtsK [Fretibacterium sp.]|nr:DNA translocase FtsK [Fretibacterium sp.]
MEELSNLRRMSAGTPFDPLDPASFGDMRAEKGPEKKYKEYEEWLDSFATPPDPQPDREALPLPSEPEDPRPFSGKGQPQAPEDEGPLSPQPVFVPPEPPVPETSPVSVEDKGLLGPEVTASQRSAVQILDDLLSSIEAGDFSMPEKLARPLEPQAGVLAEEAPVQAPARNEVPREAWSEEAAPEPEANEAAEPSVPLPDEPQGPISAASEQVSHEGEAEPTMPETEEEPSASAADEAVPDEDDGGRAPSGVFPPPLDLFGPPAEEQGDGEALAVAERQGEAIIETLKDFGVEASVAHIVVGPSVIQFQIELAPGTKVNRVSGLTNELTMALAVVSVRVEAPIPGLPYVGIEIPNSRRRGIPLRAALEDETFQDAKALLPLPMGMQVDSRFLVCGLEDMPHLLVAGTTGSGKSVFVNACILGMCSRRAPSELKLILVDPKQVEFAIYEGLPHLLARPVSDPRKAIDALAWAVQEMESRMASFARAQVRTLASYNEKVLPKDRLPSVVVVVDELADLMYTAGKEVEGLLVRLAQKARAAGIHLILATQRPSVDVITGLLKNNVPARVAFAVPSQTDSRTILDSGGADKLLGRGDMLFLSTRYRRPLRLQSPFITEERTLDFVNYVKNVFGEPEYIEFAESGGGSSDGGSRGGNGAVDDPKMEEAIHAVMEMGITSASGLQRLLSIGYPKAGRLITAMEQIGILGPQTPNSTRPRDILMDEESAYEALERARAGELFDEG